MDRLIDGIARFRADVFPQQHKLYKGLVAEGQSPTTLVISCSDSRVMPEVITQCDPGEIFVTRNAGNVVPAHGAEAGGAVSSAIEYAVVGLGVEHIVVCGHTDCGAMKALLNPDSVASMPKVADWLGHCQCARETFRHSRYDGGSEREAVRRLAMANVASQLQSLRTHPCVAARLADGSLTLHGWLFDIEAGEVLAMDGATGVFSPIESKSQLPVAMGATGSQRAVHLAAAE